MGDFQKIELDLNDKDMWDDNALIDAFDQSIRDYKLSRQDSNFSKKQKRSTREAEVAPRESVDPSPRQKKRARTSKKSNAEPAHVPPTPSPAPSPHTTHSFPVPPTPFPSSSASTNVTFTPEEMSSLLLSWYYAGYWTGRYYKQYDS